VVKTSITMPKATYEGFLSFTYYEL